MRVFDRKRSCGVRANCVFNARRKNGKLAEEALEELVDMEKGAQLEILGNIANMNFPDEMLEMIDKGEMHEEIIAELEIFSNAIDAFEKIAADSPVKELDFLQKCIDSFKT